MVAENESNCHFNNVFVYNVKKRLFIRFVDNAKHYIVVINTFI